MTFRNVTDPAAIVRLLIRQSDRACLSTGLAEPDCDTAVWPFGSLVMLACNYDTTPILLMSDLAEHARNLARDPRASLMLDGTAGRTDPLTGPRVTLVGQVRKDDDPKLRRRYLARHRAAEFYADFADFHFYRFEVVRAHLVAGFGKVHRLDPAQYVAAASASWAEREAQLLDFLAPHAARIANLSGQAESTDASCTILGADPEGIDLKIANRIARYGFPETIAEPADVEAFINSLLAAG